MHSMHLEATALQQLEPDVRHGHTCGNFSVWEWHGRRHWLPLLTPSLQHTGIDRQLDVPAQHAQASGSMQADACMLETSNSLCR